MTALALVRYQDGIVIYADTATYDPEGRILHFATKMLPLMHLPAILATKGDGVQGLYIDSAIQLSKSFDDAVERMPKIIDEMHILATLNRQEPNITVLLGGYSFTDGQWKAVEWWHGYNEDGELLSGSREIAGFSMHPPLDTNEPLLKELGVTTEEGAALRPPRDSDVIAFMESARSQDIGLGPHAVGKEGCVVGGCIFRAALSATGVVMNAIHSWPDEIGDFVGGRAPRRADEVAGQMPAS